MTEPPAGWRQFTGRQQACHSDGMSRFAPGASFAVVTQKDGSFAVEVREPRRVFPLRITGYATEAEAKAAVVTFTAAEPPDRPRDPAAPPKPVEDIEGGREKDAAGDTRDPAAAAQKAGKRQAQKPTKKPAKKQGAKAVRRAAAKGRKR